jgi:uncharacterized protein YdhG (YjbR/CyaY superfamily)
VNKPGNPMRVLHLITGWLTRWPPSSVHSRPVRILRLMSAVDDYFASLDPSSRAAFEHIRTVVLEIVPDVDEGQSYGMAAIKYQNKPLLGFLATKKHLSIFPFSPEAVDVVRDRLATFELSKGTIRFTAANPVPDDVLRDVVRYRLEEITGVTG